MSTRRITTLYATLGWLLVCIVALLLAASAASAQSARDDRPMGFDEARHLLNRTSFAAQTSDIENYARLTRAEAVDRLLAETRRHAAFPAPVWTAKYERVYRPDMTQEQRMQANRRELVERGLEIRTWWVAEMLSTPTPLTEKMTLFWHNHFATSNAKVNNTGAMIGMYDLLGMINVSGQNPEWNGLYQEPLLFGTVVFALSGDGKSQNISVELRAGVDIGNGDGRVVELDDVLAQVRVEHDASR